MILWQNLGGPLTRGEGGGGQLFSGRNLKKKTSDVPKQFSEKSRRLSLIGSEILDFGSGHYSAKF